MQRAGSNPGSKSSATERNWEHLKETQRRGISADATGSLRLGAERSQVQILSPRREDPANHTVRVPVPGTRMRLGAIASIARVRERRGTASFAPAWLHP